MDVNDRPPFGAVCAGAMKGMNGRSGRRARFLVALKLMAALGAVLVAGCAQPLAHQTGDPSGGAPLKNAAARQVSGPPPSAGWTSFGGDADLASVPNAEQAVTTTTVSRLRRAWSARLPDLADERPILIRGLALPDGTARDVLYLTTDHGTLLALDAATGAQLWAATPKSDNPEYTRASPAADPIHNLVYSYGLDGKVHRFRASTGQEVLGNGWPVAVTRMPRSEKVSSALNLANGYLYVTTASFSGDAPPYQGHLVVIDVKSGAKRVFNSLCNDHTHLLALGECQLNGGGIWGRPAVTVDPLTGHIFFAISDAPFDINKGGHNWGDTVVEMSADGSQVLDSYTPENYASEAYQNRDLGSVSPVLLPAIPTSRTPYLAVQGGKEGLLRLLNRQNLSGQGGPGHVGGELQTLELPDLCPVLAQPLAWRDPAGGGLWLYVATLCHMDAFRVMTSPQGVTTLQPAWKMAVNASSPIIVGSVLFAAVSNNLLALDPHTGRQVWSSALATAGGNLDRIHWESPIFVAGRLYCTDETSHLNMYQI